MVIHAALIALSLALAQAPTGSPQKSTDASTGAEAAASPSDPAKEEKAADRVSVTKHSITLGSRTLSYTATTGYTKLLEESGKERANLFSIAYVKDGVEDPATRPITFVFNGGPGSSSVWLHLGACGPKRVLMDDEGFAPPPPYSFVDNEATWLDATDLVFIDPVGTGYSRPAEGREQKEFSGLTPDIESVGEFIRLYTTRNARWSSPKFLAGESYGTTRAAGLSEHLQDRHGMYLNGIVLVSCILNFQTARFDAGNDLPYVLYLPTYAATAHYHRALPEDLQRRVLADVLGEVEQWAIGEYLLALAQGDTLPVERRNEIARRLARYTGLSEEYVRNANLRVSIGRFTKELLRERRRTVGRLDSRFLGIDLDSAGERFEHDPSMSAILGPYTATMNDYVRRTLAYENDLPYEVLTGRVQPWSFAEHENRYVNVAEALRRAMTENPALRVHVASGRFDLATPYFATEYTISHLGLDPTLRPNISASLYDAGHMMYIQKASLLRLHDEVAAFIAGATGGARAPGR